MKDFYQAEIEITEATSEEIKLKTVVQRNSNHFRYGLRKKLGKRLTTSNVGSIANRKAKTKVKSMHSKATSL